MKKNLSIIIIAFVIAGIFVPFPIKKAYAKEDGKVLNIMNWEDYIGEEVIEDFEREYEEKHGEKIKVNYSTQGTNEDMYTQITLNKNIQYDLVCPSEYMIQKMIVEDMLEPLHRDDKNNVDIYDEGVSPYIEDVFQKTKITNTKGEEVSLYDYACCYMWGTMGYTYNPKVVDEEDIQSWGAIWDYDYKNKSTIKNSVRDSYVLAVGYAKQEKLNELALNRASGSLSDEDYNKELTEIFNNVEKDSLDMAYSALSTLIPNLYGFEVDSGKKDMATGKLLINFAWSGDAVYTLDYAEDPEEVGEENVTKLKYVVPKEGSNIFFDGWVMPKGANVELAQEFLNFIERPDIALRNMDYIGYTTAIATDEIFDCLVSHDEDGYDYGYTSEEITEENGKYYIEEDGKKIELYAHDLTYLFKNKDGNTSENRARENYIIYNDIKEKNRQLDTQYPDYETVIRCTVMRHFDADETKALTDMWLKVISKGSNELKILYITIGITFLLAIILITLQILDKHGIFNYRHVKKGYKVISVDGKKPLIND